MVKTSNLKPQTSRSLSSNLKPKTSRSLSSNLKPQTSNLLVSIIIPSFDLSDYLVKETIPALLAQTYRNFEIIILPDQKTRRRFLKTRIISVIPKKGPAEKRDLGAAKARGEILAFLDDDSYPTKDWLKNAVGIFAVSGRSVAGVCGPQLTPPGDGWRQKISGFIWSSRLGSWGAGVYRSSVRPRRFVDDYPTVNLFITKKAFFRVGGFDSRFWPGEDTKLCHDLIHKIGKKIIYDPSVVVYHHRRDVFRPHLKQIGRYALHRGHFARILPQTSFRFGYFVPSLFSFGILAGALSLLVPGRSIFSFFLFPFQVLLAAALVLYLVLVILTAIGIYIRERDLKILVLFGPAIFLTHFYYGLLFLRGFLDPHLKSRYQR